MGPDKRRRAPLVLRLAAALALTALQSIVAAHVHEIAAPVRAASVRRAEAGDAAAECPICHLAAQTRAVAATAPAPQTALVAFFVRVPRIFAASSAAPVLTDARGPPAAA